MPERIQPEDVIKVHRCNRKDKENYINLFPILSVEGVKFTNQLHCLSAKARKVPDDEESTDRDEKNDVQADRQGSAFCTAYWCKHFEVHSVRVRPSPKLKPSDQ